MVVTNKNFVYNKMARIMIREKPEGFYVMTYREIIAGPFKTYSQAKKYPSQVLYQKKSRSQKRSKKSASTKRNKTK